jgi:uncharacterized protein (DUF427 family)
VKTRVREKVSGNVLAEGDATVYEGNLYFTPEAVQASSLKISERTYSCPDKGTCNWVDYLGANGRTVFDVAWNYDHAKPRHEAIQGRFGFHAGARGPTVEER